MQTESIFHKLVKDENSYTQLLCNMLKRDEFFRDSFLRLVDPELTVHLDPRDIRAQERPGECGQPDIRINSQDLLMIIEVKTDPRRGMTANQLLVDKGNNYVRYLRQEAKGRSSVWIVYLAPREWTHWDYKAKSIVDFSRRTDGPVKAKLISWEQLSPILTRPADTAGAEISLAKEFRLLLSQRFGPVSFNREEVQTMFSLDLPLEVFLKLVKVIDEVRCLVDRQIKLEIHKEEFGFYTDKEQRRYIGCWLEIWKTTGSPICFGIRDARPSEEAAFAESLMTVYGEEPLKEDNWIVGFVPKKDVLDAALARSILDNIQTVFGAVSNAEGLAELPVIA